MKVVTAHAHFQYDLKKTNQKNRSVLSHVYEDFLYMLDMTSTPNVLVYKSVRESFTVLYAAKQLLITLHYFHTVVSAAVEEPF